MFLGLFARANESNATKNSPDPVRSAQAASDCRRWIRDVRSGSWLHWKHSMIFCNATNGNPEPATDGDGRQCGRWRFSPVFSVCASDCILGGHLTQLWEEGRPVPLAWRHDSSAPAFKLQWGGCSASAIDNFCGFGKPLATAWLFAFQLKQNLLSRKLVLTRTAVSFASCLFSKAAGHP